MSLARPETARRSRFVAIGLMTAAVFCFALLDTSAKWLNQTLDPLQVTWARYAISVVAVSLFVNPVTTPGVLRTRRPWLQIGRSLLLLASTILNFVALRHLQLAETISIQFSAPFMVALLAGPLLGEWVGPRRLIAITIGFLGVLLVARPGLGGLHPAALLSFTGAICYALYAIMTRMLASYDSSRTTLVYSGLAGLVAMTPILPLIWVQPTTILEWALLIAVGLFGGLGHWFLILAYARAPAAVLAPFLYSQIIWMLLLGWGVFGQWPDIWTLVGAGIVVASGLYLLNRERTP